MMLRIKFSNQCQRVKTPPVRSSIIVAAAPNRSKSGDSIHLHRRITVANLKVNTTGAFFTGSLDEIIEQATPDPAPMMTWEDRQQQELGLVGDCPRQRKADHRGACRFASDDQADAGHRENSGALGARPRFAEAAAERAIHDLHDFIEVFRAAAPETHFAVDCWGCHQAACFALASGARA